MKKITVILFVLISIFSGDQVYGFQKEEKSFQEKNIMQSKSCLFLKN